MSEFSKQALKVENNTNFPNNSTGYITPVLLREFNTDMIDSTVNQTVYTEDSQSWVSSIEAINSFTASASGLSTGSLMLTASAASNVITFTKGDGTQFNVTVADTTDLGPLNAFTASATISINSLNNFTSSNGISQLNSYTASNDTKWNNLGAQSGSWITESETGSFAKLDGGNTFNGNQIISGNVTTTGGFYGNGAGITGITASVSLPILDEGIPQGNAVSMNFTGSGISATIVGGTAVVSVNVPDAGTLNALTASFNTYTGSNDAKVNSLIAATASYANSASVAAVDSAQQAEINSLTAATASVNNSITSLNTFTSSQDSKNSTLASYTGSNDTKWSTLGGQSGSWVTESETGSFARVDVSNTFTAAQTINADLNVSGTINAYKLNVTIESSSVIYSSGSNQFGDAANDTQTLYGSTNVVNALTASGLHYPTADGTQTGMVLQTDAAGTLSFGNTTTLYETVKNGETTTLTKGTVVYISGSTGANPNVFRADSGNPLKMPAAFLISEPIASGATGRGITLGLATGIDVGSLVAGTQLWVDGNGSIVTSRPTGSSDIVQPFAVVTKTGTGGQLNVLNPGPVLLPNVQKGYLWVGDGTNQPIAVATSSLVTSPTDISALNAFTQSAQSQLTALESATASYANSASVAAVDLGQQTQINNLIAWTSSVVPTDISALNSFTASQQTLNTTLATTGSNTFNGNQIINGALTASLTEGYVWAGGAGNVSTLVATSSFGGGGTPTDIGPLNAFTASQQILNTTFATTGSNVFRDTQVISGSILVSGSIDLFTEGGNGFAYSGKALFLTNSVQTGITIESPIHFYQVGKGDFYMQNNVAGVGSGSMNITAANGATLNISSSTLNVTAPTMVVTSTNPRFTSGLQVTGSITAQSDVTLLETTGNTTLTLGPYATAGEGTGIRLTRNNTARNSNLNIIASSSAFMATLASGSGYYNTVSIQSTATGSNFSDYNGTGFSQFLNIPPNVAGSNPKPILPRGLEVTGSTEVGMFTASLAEGYVWVGNSLGKTTTVATSSFGGGGAAFPYTGSAQITGSLGITGSLSGLPITISVAASTASIDMTAGNTFVLDIPTGSTTHIVPTNIKAGQTINLLLKQAAGATTGSVAWSPLVLFPSGIDMVATATGSAMDLVSMISFDTTNLMAANVKNLK